MKLENLWVYVDSQGNKHRLSGCGLKSESRRRLIEKIENDTLLAERKVYKQGRESLNNKGGEHHE